MSRAVFEVRRPARRWGRQRSLPLNHPAVQATLERLVGNIRDVRTPGVDQWDWTGRYAIGHLRVERDTSDAVVAVTASLWGHSDDDEGNRADAVALVMPLLELAEATGAELQSSFGTVTRSTPNQVLDAAS